MNRESASAHWEYTRWIVEHELDTQRGLEHMLELMRYLYVEAMIHGYKHGKEETTN